MEVPTLLAQPTLYVGCFTLHLYCDRRHDDPRDGFAEFFGQTESFCLMKAKKARWRINRTTRTATCPACTSILHQAAHGFSAERVRKKHRPRVAGLGG